MTSCCFRELSDVVTYSCRKKKEQENHEGLEELIQALDGRHHQ